jgi:hypothetical protein
LKNSVVTKYQGILGLLVLVGTGIWIWSHLTGLTPEESPIRAQAAARELALAVLDYRADTGGWPTAEDGSPDLKPLLGRRAAQQATRMAMAQGGGLNGLGGLGAEGSGLGREMTWVREIPLDPWGGAYHVAFAGTRVAVLSAGPNGRLDTDASRLWSRPAGINPADGDDVCVVLDMEQDGGS